QFVDEFRDGKCLGDVAGEFPRADQVPDHQRENLVGVDEGAVAVDGPDAVAVTVGGETGVILSGEDRLAQSVNVRLDGFGMHATESRVAGAANFVADHAVTRKKFFQQAGGRAVHRVNDEK